MVSLHVYILLLYNIILLLVLCIGRPQHGSPDCNEGIDYDCMDAFWESPDESCEYNNYYGACMHDNRSEFTIQYIIIIIIIS